ncbi:HPP family protein [Nocardioides cynanchi]|uniref:CBS domain-containing protein n=1 Tax=Nocardioides cynanchi TaxID=2558918 RepID=UPI0012457351|nr:CBS domain-containing protein [Nocardioides cynanchi]
MLVREVMTSPAVTVTAEASLREAIGLLDRHTITALPVVDEAGRPLGVVSEADLLREALGRGAHETVGEVMTSPVRTVSADSTLTDAFAVMDGTVVKSLPVTLHGRVVGVVSRRDLVAALARGDLDPTRTSWSAS